MALPLGIITAEKEKILSFAVKLGESAELEKLLAFITEIEVRLIEVNCEILELAIFQAYNQDQAYLSSLSSLLSTQDSPKVKGALEQIDYQKSVSDSANFLKALIDFAIASDASDIHLIPTRSGTKVRVRIQGFLRENTESIASKKHHGEIINRLKVLAKLDLSLKRVPQEGGFRIECGPQPVIS